MKIQNLLKLFSFLFVLSLMIASCSKEAVEGEKEIPGKIDPTEEVDQNSLFTRSVTSSDGLDLDCITIIYPFDVIDDAGETYTIEGEDDFATLLDEDSETFIVDFVYPLEIEDEDENTSTVASGEELGEAFANCLPNTWDENAFPAYLINDENSCVTLQYPITVSKLDGSTATYDDEASFVAALAEEPLFFVFPMSIINGEGETIVVSDVDDLLTALLDCNGLDIDTTIWNGGNDFEFLGCYELAFPFTVTLVDGTTVEVNDHMEYCDLLLEGSVQGFVFPLTLIGEEGEIVVNSEEELNALLADCFDFGPDVLIADLVNLYIGALGADSLGIDPCYEITFPMNAQEFDWEGNSLDQITINSFDELAAIFEDGSAGGLYNVVYPVTVTLTATGEEIELQSTEDLFELMFSCQ